MSLLRFTQLVPLAEQTPPPCMRKREDTDGVLPAYVNHRKRAVDSEHRSMWLTAYTISAYPNGESFRQ